MAVSSRHEAEELRCRNGERGRKGIKEFLRSRESDDPAATEVFAHCRVAPAHDTPRPLPAPLARYRTEAVAGQPSQAPRVRCCGASRRFGISPALNLLRSQGALRSTSTSLPRWTFSMAGQRTSRRRMRSASGSSGSRREPRGRHRRRCPSSTILLVSSSAGVGFGSSPLASPACRPRRRLAFVGGLVVRCRLTR